MPKLLTNTNKAGVPWGHLLLFYSVAKFIGVFVYALAVQLIAHLLLFAAALAGIVKLLMLLVALLVGKLVAALVGKLVAVLVGKLVAVLVGELVAVLVGELIAALVGELVVLLVALLVRLLVVLVHLFIHLFILPFSFAVVSGTASLCTAFKADARQLPPHLPAFSAFWLWAAGQNKAKVLGFGVVQMDVRLNKGNCMWRLFCFGCLGYPLLELIWRGHTHWSMALAGGCAVLLLGHVARRRCTFAQKCLIGALAITAVEFGFGLLFNVIGGLQVWDYSAQPFNVMGQICLPFCLLWLLLSALLMPFLCRAVA